MLIGGALALAVLAFSHGDSIYSMAADGSGRTRITTGGEPAYSPSGDALAFTRSPSEERSEIWIAAPDGSGARRLVASARDGDYAASPAWSPDGSEIAFAHFSIDDKVGLVSQIEVIDRNGGGRRAVAAVKPRGVESVADPVWTPDGRRVVYTRTRAGEETYRFELRSVAADGSGDARFLPDAAGAAFSPDGTRIAFSDSSIVKGTTCGSDECFPNGELAVAAADGSGRRVLFESESDESSPSWSPDGARIAFHSGRNVPGEDYGGEEVYTIAPDGTCLTWLTNGDEASGLPVWAPGAGASAASGCGGVNRPALIELKLPKRAHGAWWVGRPMGAALLSSVDGHGRGAIFSYDDCSAFAPGDCPPGFSLSSQDMCHGGPAQRGFAQSLGTLRRARGGALAATRNGGDEISLVVLSGRSAITVQLARRVAPKQRRALFDQVIAGLRPYGSRRAAKLPPPRVDKSLRRFLKRDLAAC
jgi:Tol biopolymer transport system component